MSKVLSNMNTREENMEYLKRVIGTKGKQGKQIDWVNSIGKEIECEYVWFDENPFKDILKIHEYKNGKIYFEGYEKGIYRSHLTKGCLGSIFGFISSEFKYEIGDTMNCLIIIDKEYRKDEKDIMWKYYKYKCNICGYEDWIKEGVFKRKLGCNVCGDGISYPEKFIEKVLIQLNVKHERQYKTNWSQNKRYDFYLPDYNAIIEVHGEQHYRYTGRGRSLKEEQENDKFKEELALKNGIKHYIVIDCRKSDSQYIKSNLFNSELNELFDSLLNKLLLIY